MKFQKFSRTFDIETNLILQREWTKASTIKHKAFSFSFFPGLALSINLHKIQQASPKIKIADVNY